METIDKDDIGLLKELVHMSDDQIQKMLDDKEKEAERLKKLVPQLDEMAEYETFINDENKLAVVDWITLLGAVLASCLRPLSVRWRIAMKKKVKPSNFAKLIAIKIKKLNNMAKLTVFPLLSCIKMEKKWGNVLELEKNN